jgi:hypothetical protein
MGKGGGGHGGLNILPQKSWHVWNAKNLSQVERDEERHAAEQEALQQKQRALEQERRVEQLLRRRRGGGDGGGAGGPGGSGSTAITAGQHVNLFEPEERRKLGGGGGNAAHEAEKVVEAQREARRAGLVLGEQADRRGDRRAAPWYVQGAGTTLESLDAPERGVRR